MLSRVVKIISFVALLLCCFVALLSPVFATEKNAFVTIVNPVRGKEFWGFRKQMPLIAVAEQYRVIKKQELSATWLLRYDVLKDQQLVSFFQKISPIDNNKRGNNQELGVFLEITPSLTKRAGVSYPEQGIFWHDAHRVFLSGYKPEERRKLIDAVFEQFLTVFGFYPKSVGAWHVDAYSAAFMREKYGVKAVLICADQFATDNYQIWGQPWGTSYFPSRFNIQIPAQTSQNKLDVVVFQWAVRDPERGYGGGVKESTFSVQVNDYLKHGLGTDYFQKLVAIYTDILQNPFGQITVGLENDQDWEKYAQEYKNQIEVVAIMKRQGKVKVVTMSEFVFWYKNHFPRLSPRMEIKNSASRWVSSPQLRLGLVLKDGQEYIRDLRIYNEKWPEPYFLTPNPWPELSLSVSHQIDTVRFPDKVVPYKPQLLQGKLALPFSFSKKLALLLCCFAALLLTLFFLKNKWLGVLVFGGTLTQSLPMVKSGLLSPYGMGFWGPNGHDGIWHLALINQIARGRLGHPTFAGFRLTNYHFGFDLLVALIYKLTGIPVINLYFQILPVIFSLLLGVLAYLLVKKWTESESAALLSTFFVYFGGSWGWLVSLFKDQNWGGESMFWANQAVSFLINPPYALSIIVLLLGLYFFFDYLQKSTKKLLIVLSLFFGTLIQIKVYVGIIVLGSLFLLVFYSLIRYRNKAKTFSLGRLFLGSGLVALVVFLPFNWQASSLLVFSPFWLPHMMLAFQDRLGWVRLENARQAYLATRQWLKYVLAEGLTLGIFIVGNLGTRILGAGWLISLMKGVKKGDKEDRKIIFEVFLALSLLISLTLTLTLTQKGNPWNSIQFFYYFQFILGILAGVYLAKILSLMRQRILRGAVVLGIIFLTLPTTLATLEFHYLPSRPPARISFDELEALEFLRNQPEDIVLTYPYNSDWRKKFVEPKPLYAYETTAYVSALSDKQTFLADEMNLEISGYLWRSRREKEIRFFGTDNSQWARKFLQENQIRYIYLVKGQKMNLGEDDVGARKIFENGEVKILKVN